MYDLLNSGVSIVFYVLAAVIIISAVELGGGSET